MQLRNSINIGYDLQKKNVFGSLSTDIYVSNLEIQVIVSIRRESIASHGKIIQLNFLHGSQRTLLDQNCTVKTRSSCY